MEFLALSSSSSICGVETISRFKTKKKVVSSGRLTISVIELLAIINYELGDKEKAEMSNSFKFVNSIHIANA